LGPKVRLVWLAPPCKRNPGHEGCAEDPQHPVTQEFVQTLATLEMQSDPKYRLPKYDKTNKEAWMKVRDAYSVEFNKQVADHMLGVGASLQ
jgi:hypothetical protein